MLLKHIRKDHARQPLHLSHAVIRVGQTGGLVPQEVADRRFDLGLGALFFGPAVHVHNLPLNGGQQLGRHLLDAPHQRARQLFAAA